MIAKDESILLRDGREAVLATPKRADAAELLALMKQTAGETEYLSFYPEEWTGAVCDEEEWIEGMRQSERDLVLICRVGDEIAGICNLAAGKTEKTRHYGTVGISILQKFWGLGIGGELLTRQERAGRALGLDYLELDYLEGNERGRRLYHRLGYRAVAHLPNAVLTRDGRYLGRIYMRKRLGEEEEALALSEETAALIEGVPHPIANLANVAALIYERMWGLNWCGFYLRRGDVLVLGPFVGKPACIEIPIGKGVCGGAVAAESTLLVDDVHAFPGHIACDGDSRSEIVVPLWVGGEIVGVMDLDSPLLARFDEGDRQELERIAARVGRMLEQFPLT